MFVRLIHLLPMRVVKTLSNTKKPNFTVYWNMAMMVATAAEQMKAVVTERLDAALLPDEEVEAEADVEADDVLDPDDDADRETVSIASDESLALSESPTLTSELLLPDDEDALKKTKTASSPIEPSLSRLLDEKLSKSNSSSVSPFDPVAEDPADENAVADESAPMSDASVSNESSTSIESSSSVSSVLLPVEVDPEQYATTGLIRFDWSEPEPVVQSPSSLSDSRTD